jgi:hypothetical protein
MAFYEDIGRTFDHNFRNGFVREQIIDHSQANDFLQDLATHLCALRGIQFGPLIQQRPQVALRKTP